MFDVLVVVAVKVILLGNEAREICRRFGTATVREDGNVLNITLTFVVFL